MINLLYIDLFCGAGGTSLGVNSASLSGEKCAKVVACVNHDAVIEVCMNNLQKQEGLKDANGNLWLGIHKFLKEQYK